MLKLIPAQLWDERVDLFPKTHWEFINYVVYETGGVFVRVKYWENGYT